MSFQKKFKKKDILRQTHHTLLKHILKNIIIPPPIDFLKGIKSYQIVL